MYRSSSMGMSVRRSPNRSGPAAGTLYFGKLMTRSGSPICHACVFWNSGIAGMSAGLPRGAPASTQAAILAICSSLSDGSSLKSWMPMVLSTCHGGISRLVVRVLIARAHGRTCSYVVSGIGAMSLVKVTCCAAAAVGSVTTAATANDMADLADNIMGLSSGVDLEVWHGRPRARPIPSRVSVASRERLSILESTPVKGAIPSSSYTRLHLRFGWWSLLIFAALGLALETLQ